MNAPRYLPGLNPRGFLTASAAGLRAAGLALLVSTAAIALVACDGPSSSPQVPSLGKSAADGGGSGGSASTTSGNPTQLLDEWAACIRKHGDPSQTDPTIDANKDIQITMDNVPETLASEVHAGTGPCSTYLDAASLELNGGRPQPTVNPVQGVKFAECMRANGFPNWPDPTGQETDLQGTGIDPNSPAVQNAWNTCDKKVGLPEYPNGTGPGDQGTIEVFSCNAPPGKQCPSRPPANGGGNRPRPVPSGNGGSGGNG